MNIILTTSCEQNEIVTIEIFNSSRGAGGTLAYPVKINEKKFFFEIDDEGVWQPFPKTNDVSAKSLIAIDEFIRIVEKQRLKCPLLDKLAP